MKQATAFVAALAARCAPRVIISTLSIALLVSPATMAVTWDSQALTGGGNPAGAGTQWWFDHFNWGGTGNTPDPLNPDPPPGFLPPASSNTGAGPSTAEVTVSTTTLPGGEGIVYDPDNDPKYAEANTWLYPAGFDRITQYRVYLARNTTATSQLTIKSGSMTFKRDASDNTAQFIVGRSGSSAGSQNLGKVVQTGGTVTLIQDNLDIGQREAGIGWGNGVYDYRGGILSVSENFTGNAIRLSHGSASTGTGGHGRFIMHNPVTDGYVRTYNFATASDGNSGDGILTGVGINEFHFENGGTRPIQVINNLSINNGPVSTGSSIKRSARLELVLHEAPAVDEMGKPETIGLFDTRFTSAPGTGIQGTGDLDGDGITNNDRVFSSADGTRHFYPSSRWAAVKTSPTFGSLNLQDEDFLLTAAFGSKLYRWEVSYSGDITWEGNGNTGNVASVVGTGGSDVVLIGYDSIDISLPGDFNNDGKVNAADYVLWRKNPENYGGTPGGYNAWRANFGNPPGAGSSLDAAAVPEPSLMVLAALAAVGAAISRRQRVT